MKSIYRPNPGAQRLVDAMLDSVITNAELGELSRLLTADAARRAWYCEYVGLHGLIDAELKAGPGKPPQPTGTADINAQRSNLGFLSDVIARVPGGEFVVGGLVLLAVSGAVWGVIHFTRGARHTNERQMFASDSDGSAGRSVGSLATDERARWAQQSPASTEASVRIGQRYELAAGCAKIELARGTTVTIEGPAVWQLSSDQRFELESGKLLAVVPKNCVGFTVVTPTAEVVDLGTEFGVDVDRSGSTELHVIRGRVALKSTAAPSAPGGRKQEVVAGQAVRVSAGSEVASPIPLDRGRFETTRTAKTHSVPAVARAGESSADASPIWLGNLFDDFAFTGVTLSVAIKRDEFRAQALATSLGVDRVVYAGSPVKEIASGVSFDFTNLGWEDMAYAEAPVTNDAWYSGGSFTDQDGARGGIRTRGTPMHHNAPRIEEGIGQHANALITFDLDEIRAAGGLEGAALEFRSDRAGINDECIGIRPDKPASAHMAVIVSTAEGVRQAFIDGRSMETAEHDHIWRVAQAIGEPLKADGRFVEFRVPLPPDAKWLTLLSASAGDGHFADHAVWSGARLEIVH